MRGKVHEQLSGGLCTVCSKTDCCHWPVIESDTLLTVLEENHIPLEHFNSSQIGAMKVEELDELIVILKLKPVKGKLSKIQIVESWYQDKYIRLKDIEDAAISSVIINIKVRGLEVGNKNDVQKRKYLKELMIKEIYYRKEKHIEENGGNIVPLEDACPDLLHLQVPKFIFIPQVIFILTIFEKIILFLKMNVCYYLYLI